MTPVSSGYDFHWAQSPSSPQDQTLVTSHTIIFCWTDNNQRYKLNVFTKRLNIGTDSFSWISSCWGTPHWAKLGQCVFASACVCCLCWMTNWAESECVFFVFFFCVCCLCGAQRANEGGVDTLMSPLRKQVQGQPAHSLYHAFLLSLSQTLASFTFFT